MEEISKRELAFCYIYSQEIQEQNSRNQVKLFLDCQEVEDPRVREYVKDMARGIKENNEAITGKISQNLKKGWTIDRLSTVDLSILKLAIYEIEYKKMPYKIIINEAVNCAKKYGEESSASFVNGVLASVVAQMSEEDKK